MEAEAFLDPERYAKGIFRSHFFAGCPSVHMSANFAKFNFSYGHLWSPSEPEVSRKWTGNECEGSINSANDVIRCSSVMFRRNIFSRLWTCDSVRICSSYYFNLCCSLMGLRRCYAKIHKDRSCILNNSMSLIISVDFFK